jgi:hypothetical protein
MVTIVYFSCVASQQELCKSTKGCRGFVSKRRILGPIMSEYAFQNTSTSGFPDRGIMLVLFERKIDLRLGPDGVNNCIYIYTYLLTYGAEIFFRSCQLCSPSRTPQHFMEAEGLIPCSQEPFTGPFPEPYQCNPLHLILSLSNPF